MCHNAPLSEQLEQVIFLIILQNFSFTLIFLHCILIKFNRLDRILMFGRGLHKEHF